MQHTRTRRALAAVVAAAFAVSACSNTVSDTQASPSVLASSSASPATTGSDAKHNDADVTFAQGMIPHHQQAIEMSDMLLAKDGVDTEIVALATQIKNAQGPEIEQMQGWLRDWGVASAPPQGMPGMGPGHEMPGGNMGEMPGMGPGHEMPGGDMDEMPAMGAGHGMMSHADMVALQNAHGTEAGPLFLRQMIEHHEGAITMAEAEIDNGQFPAAIEMARNIASSQQKEITTMRGLLG